MNGDREAWIAIKLFRGEPEIIGLCGNADAAQRKVAQNIAAVCQVERIVAAKLPWKVQADGTVRLLYDRDDRRFHFRLEPWSVET